MKCYMNNCNNNNEWACMYRDDCDECTRDCKNYYQCNSCDYYMDDDMKDGRGINMNRTYSLAKSSDELKKLILENPDLPIVVLAGEDANDGYWGWMYCSSITFSIGEILDCDFYDLDHSVFVDRDRLEEKIADDIYDENEEASDEYCEELIKRELEKYEPYWKKVITIYATN